MTKELAKITLKLRKCFENMGHRDLLSQALKSKKVDSINSILENYHSKSITKTFYNFILDRNKYTHGELMYWYPEKKTLLEYKNNQTHLTEYGEVNREILNSYIEAYKELNEFLRIVRTAVQ